MKKIFIMICVIMLICVSPNIIMASTESNSLMEDTPQQDIYNQDTLVKNISTNQEDSQTNISMTNELDDLSTEKKQQNNQKFYHKIMFPNKCSKLFMLTSVKKYVNISI